ncbi:MAG: hypothetical protein HFE45_11575 [Oscillospiraceae bacterium]|nr:hypothetical protein [Oscillospiraceae bacterium]
MTRTEFMTELAIRLEPLPENDRWDALQFYEEYFDDAGRDKEQDVIAELKSPAALAARIIGSPGVFPPRPEPAVDAIAAEPENFGSYTQRPPFEQAAEQTAEQPPFEQTYAQQNPFEQTAEQAKEQQPPFEQTYTQQNPFEQSAEQNYEPPRQRSAAFWILLAVLSPIWLSLLLGVIITAFTVFFTAISILFAFAATALALMISGLICLPVGFVHLFSDPLNGVFTFSIGLLCAGFALMLTPGTLWLIKRTVPAMARGLKKMFQGIIRFFRG